MECSGEFDGIFDATDPEMLKSLGINIKELLISPDLLDKTQAYGKACLKLEKYAYDNSYNGILFKSAQTEYKGIKGRTNIVLFDGRWSQNNFLGVK